MYPAAIRSTMSSISIVAARFPSYLAGARLFMVAGCSASEAPTTAVDGGGTGRADSSIDVIWDASEPTDSRDAGAADVDVTRDASASADAAADGAAAPHNDAGTGLIDGAVEDAEGAVEDAESDAASEGEELSRIVGWSVRKRLATTSGADILLEEALVNLASVSPAPSKLVVLNAGGAAVRSWTAPGETSIADFCVHPSGAASLVLLDRSGDVSLVRLDQDLAALGTLTVHDARIASDPHVTDAGALDLVANRLTEDAARIGAVGEDVVATVFTSWNSVIARSAACGCAGEASLSAATKTVRSRTPGTRTSVRYEPRACSEARARSNLSRHPTHLEHGVHS
jgi:hypothetical protein